MGFFNTLFGCARKNKSTPTPFYTTKVMMPDYSEFKDLVDEKLEPYVPRSAIVFTKQLDDIFQAYVAYPQYVMNKLDYLVRDNLLDYQLEPYSDAEIAEIQNSDLPPEIVNHIADFNKRMKVILDVPYEELQEKVGQQSVSFYGKKWNMKDQNTYTNIINLIKDHIVTFHFEIQDSEKLTWGRFPLLNQNIIERSYPRRKP